MRGSSEYFLEEDGCLPSLFELQQDPGVVSIWHSLLFDILSPPPEVQPCQFLSALACQSPLPSPPLPSRLVILLSLAYSLTLAFSHMRSYRLSHFSLPISRTFFSFAHSHIAAYSPIHSLTLSSCSLREMEVCKLFSPSCMCRPGLLSVHLNELISPFFSKKLSTVSFR